MKRLVVLILSLILCTGCAQAAAPQDALSMLAINVGKADCILLTSGTSAYLIDTGTKESYGAVSATMKLHGITRLNGVIVTHTDGDHAGGLMALASSSLQVDGWYASAYFTDVKEKKHPVVLAAALRNEQVRWLKAGDQLPLDGGTLTVLGPVTADDDKENNNSVVLRAETADGSILLTGDMEFPEEQTLMEAGLLAPATVLKVANHAEKDATSDALAALVKPQIAVISTDSEAEPDTPATRVLQALKRAGAQIAVTQNAQAGVLVTLSGGIAEVSMMAYGELPAMETGVTLTDKSVAQDTVCLANHSDEAVSLSGWYLYSTRGGETFVFPEGTTIDGGASISVSSLSSESDGDFVWQETKVWHKSKADTAQLYDVYGRLVSELD